MLSELSSRVAIVYPAAAAPGRQSITHAKHGFELTNFVPRRDNGPVGYLEGAEFNPHGLNSGCLTDQGPTTKCFTQLNLSAKAFCNRLTAEKGSNGQKLLNQPKISIGSVLVKFR